jgi:nitrate reductase gamma subunit
MKKYNTPTFFISILLYLIYRKMYYTFSVWIEIMLFKFNISSALYITFLIISGILTSIAIFFLYRKFIFNKEIYNSSINKCMLLLLLVIGISSISSKYLAGIAEKVSNNDIFLKQVANYDYIDLVFSILTILLLASVFISIIKKNKDI